MRAARRFQRVSENVDVTVGTGQHCIRNWVAGWRGRMHPKAQHLCRLQPRIEHVVGITHPGHDLAFDVAALFDKREDVGQHLARMMIIGEPVDYRHSRIFGEGFDHVLMKGTNHHYVNHAANHARQIFYWLAA